MAHSNRYVRLNLVALFAQRMDRSQYAIACDDEANAHYGIEPCRWYRLKLAVKAFLSGK